MFSILAVFDLKLAAVVCSWDDFNFPNTCAKKYNEIVFIVLFSSREVVLFSCIKMFYVDPTLLTGMLYN